MSEYLNQIRAFSESKLESNDFSLLLLKFSSIHFPTAKVEKLAHVKFIDFESKNTIFNLCKMKDSCSIKKLKELMKLNQFISELFQIAKILIERSSDFPNTTRVFDALFDEIHE